MKKIMLFIISFVLLNSIVYADGTITNKITKANDGSDLRQAGFKIPYKSGIFNDFGSTMNTTLYCLSGMNYASPELDTTCATNQNLYTLEQRIRLAAIIDYGMKINQSTEQNCTKASSGILSDIPVDYTCYTQTEIAIHKYLGKSLTNPSGHEINSEYNGYGDEVIAETPSSATALAIAKSTFNPKFVLKNGDKIINNLEFTLDGSGDYVTEKIYITGDYITNDAYTVSVSGNSNAKVVGNSKEFYITIPQSSIKSITDIEVSVNNIKQQSYREAYIFDCSSDVQDIGTVATNQRDASIKITGQVGTTQLTIKKVDSKNNLIAGAKIKVENEDKTYSEVFETTEEEIILTGLQYGEYTITELLAPDKYVQVKDPIKVTLSQIDLVESVTLTNQLNIVKISKIDMANSNLLEGATLEIQDENGNVVKYCKDEEGNNIECRWVSTEEEYQIEGMPNGKYYLVEIIAPKGYVLNTEKVPFTVDGKKSIIEVEMENELEVEVPDTLSSRSALLLAIAMFDIALGIGIITYVKKNRVKEQ